LVARIISKTKWRWRYNLIEDRVRDRCRRDACGLSAAEDRLVVVVKFIRIQIEAAIHLVPSVCEKDYVHGFNVDV